LWRSSVAQFAASVDGLVPVVKGNGYGFGRARLAEIAAEFCDTVAVGTIHELGDLPSSLTPVVLTPSLTIPSAPTNGPDPILTVSRAEHVTALNGWGGRVIVKLATRMRRFGGDDESLVEVAQAAGLTVAGVSIHLPLAGAEEERFAEAIALLGRCDPALTAWFSHLGPDAYRSLPAGRTYRLRVGTSLWHGDKSTLELHADVIDVRAVRAGDQAGYQLGEVPTDGMLVMIGAGTANGVAALPDGRSPFHFLRNRLALHEPPHMHTSMVFVPSGEPVPRIGDWVDLQRPLHMTSVDEYRWL
jgi:alanine racemase